MANNSITAAKGFLAAGVSCGIKKSGKKDVGLLVCPAGGKAAAVFTTNKIVSAAVRVCKAHVKSRNISAVIVNSGNANACTGRRGVTDAIRMCKETAAGLKARGADFIREPAASGMGGRTTAFIRGPEDIRIELSERSGETYRA